MRYALMIALVFLAVTVSTVYPQGSDQDQIGPAMLLTATFDLDELIFAGCRRFLGSEVVVIIVRLVAPKPCRRWALYTAFPPARRHRKVAICP